MRIVWEASVYVGQAPLYCILCGYRTQPIRAKGNQALLAVVYNDQGIVCGEACRDCVRAGAEAIRTQLQERIQGLEAQVRGLEALAAEEVCIPTLEEEFQVYL
ncbi:hypothetical protein [Anthocerotibacter panamensis]|uniref:hypothetical protein n=1 Tax=Anthocerotibacter panamensis TaxID=2857077 RepID=UPI001C401936|nr:hypothetical protein [Anthocerotibacter panamensis]